VPADPSLNLFTAVSFLRDLRPSGPWVLTSIVPDGKTRTKTLASLQACEQFVQEEAAERKNIYYSLNPLLRVVSKKASKEDVARVEYLHVYADPRDDESPADFKARMGPLVAQLVKRPALVVDSGNGLQVLWRLQQPVEDFDLAEAANYALAKDLGADPSTRNVDRILRLPGTVNWPNKTKLRRGRVPCETRTVSSWDGSHGFEEFRREEASSDEVFGADEVSLSDALPVVDLDKLHPMVKNVLDKCLDRADTSVRMTDVALVMIREGYGDDEIAAVILTRDHPVSEHARKRSTQEMKRRDAARAIAWAHKRAERQNLSITEFYALMTTHRYIHAVSGDDWPSTSLNSRLPPVLVGTIRGKQKFAEPSRWLDKNQPVEQMTWWPGQPMVIRDYLCVKAGVVSAPGKAMFNLYRPPDAPRGDPSGAARWVAHGRKLFPGEWDHICAWFAHRVQHPGVKINHALILGSKEQGLGKDALLDPVRHAVGTWNWCDVGPQDVMGRNNDFLKSVVMCVNEARDLGGDQDSRISRFALYEHMKDMITSGRPTHRINEKYRPEYHVMNLTGVVITTNHKTGGLYLPAEDRRHCFCWSDCKLEDFDPGYFNDLFQWYRSGGLNHVAAYLTQLDVSAFDPNARPPQTEAFFEVVNSNRTSESSDFSDAIDAVHQSYSAKNVVTLAKIIDHFRVSRYDDGMFDYLTNKKNARRIPFLFEQSGYVPVRNPAAKDGLWVIEGRRQPAYAPEWMSPRDRLDEVLKLSLEGWRRMQ